MTLKLQRIGSAPENIERDLEGLEPRNELSLDIAQVADMYRGILNIHPFDDGNGRVSRLLAAELSMQALSIPYPFDLLPTLELCGAEHDALMLTQDVSEWRAFFTRVILGECQRIAAIARAYAVLSEADRAGAHALLYQATTGILSKAKAHSPVGSNSTRSGSPAVQAFYSLL